MAEDQNEEDIELYERFYMEYRVYAMGDHHSLPWLNVFLNDKGYQYSLYQLEKILNRTVSSENSKYLQEYINKRLIELWKS